MEMTHGTKRLTISDSKGQKIDVQCHSLTQITTKALRANDAGMTGLEREGWRPAYGMSVCKGASEQSQTPYVSKKGTIFGATEPAEGRIINT